MARTVRTAAGPPPLYYLAMDVTEAQDAAIFGALLEERGWKNLATTFFDPAPGDPTRLVDPAHDYLPIPLVPAKGKMIAVIAPYGRDGKGLDHFWKTYRPPAGERLEPLTGRHAAAEMSCRWAERFMEMPAIHTHEIAPGYRVRHLPDYRPYFPSDAPAARILFVSSHGWLSGRMQGDPIPDAPAWYPEQTRRAFLPSRRLFSLGKMAKGGYGFKGPEWIVLAQCSTLNSATWLLWARALEGSSPTVRGILAYEEAAPGPKPAARIAEAFFRELDQGAPFLDAWRKANQGQRWAALVHKHARTDTLTDFPRFRTLEEAFTTEDTACYRGYLPSLGPAGQPVYDLDPPIELKIEQHMGVRFEPVLPETLDESVAKFRPATRYRLTVKSNSSDALRAVRITVVHIRLSHARQFTWSKLFASATCDDQATGSPFTVSGLGSMTLTLALEQPATWISLHLVSRNPHEVGLERHHTYLWFRVEVDTDEGRRQHDFKTIGLEY